MGGRSSGSSPGTFSVRICPSPRQKISFSKFFNIVLNVSWYFLPLSLIFPQKPSFGFLNFPLLKSSKGRRTRPLVQAQAHKPPSPPRGTAPQEHPCRAQSQWRCRHQQEKKRRLS